MKLKKILVLGCNGFIGSHITKHYLNKCEQLFGLDIFETSFSKSLANFQIVNPIELRTSLDRLFQENDFDLCINCSGAASVPNSIINPLNDFELNTLNVFKILDCIRMYNSECKFINLSSAAVYGNPEKLPVKEDSKAQPISPYGIHKLMSEEICREFNINYGLKTCSLRIFSAFGPDLKKQFFWDLFQKFLNEKSVVLHGTGNETRDFIYIDDLIEAVNCVVENCSFNANVINIANGLETKIKEVAFLFKDKYNSDKEIQFNGIVRNGDPINWRADVTILSEFGYKQKIGIEEGIEKYLIWLQQ